VTCCYCCCCCCCAQTPRFVLSPHIYPTSVTGAIDEIAAAIDTITYRWDQSWGWKMQGVDTTFQVSGASQHLQLPQSFCEVKVRWRFQPLPALSSCS
jgi:hypothetical protein